MKGPTTTNSKQTKSNKTKITYTKTIPRPQNVLTILAPFNQAVNHDVKLSRNAWK